MMFFFVRPLTKEQKTCFIQNLKTCNTFYIFCFFFIQSRICLQEKIEADKDFKPRETERSRHNQEQFEKIKFSVHKWFRYHVSGLIER